MKIQSLTFGEIEIKDNTIYTFDEGIPGLGEITQFAIVDSEEMAPFAWLQACEEPFLSLMMLDPVLIKPDYSVRFNDEHTQLLGTFSDEDIAVRVLVVVPKNPEDMTANLLAPIVLNHKLRKGAQIVVDGHRDLLRCKVINS